MRSTKFNTKPCCGSYRRLTHIFYNPTTGDWFHFFVVAFRCVVYHFIHSSFLLFIAYSQINTLYPFFFSHYFVLSLYKSHFFSLSHRSLLPLNTHSFFLLMDAPLVSLAFFHVALWSGFTLKKVTTMIICSR